MYLKLFKTRCKDSKQHHVMFHELYSVSSLLCIAQNVRFEIPFLMIFKYYAWVSCGNRVLITGSCAQKQTNFLCEYSVDYLLLCATEKSHMNNSSFVFHFVFRVSAIFG